MTNWHWSDCTPHTEEDSETCLPLVSIRWTQKYLKVWRWSSGHGDFRVPCQTPLWGFFQNYYNIMNSPLSHRGQHSNLSCLLWMDGTGTLKDKDEDNRREVGECDWWVCVLEVIDTPEVEKSIGISRKLNSWILRKEVSSRWVCKNKSLTNILCNLPDVLVIVGIKEMELRVVCYESIKRELKRRLIYEYRCDESLRLKMKNLHVSQTLGWSWNWNT